MSECSATTFTRSFLCWFKAAWYNKSFSRFLGPAGWTLSGFSAHLQRTSPEQTSSSGSFPIRSNERHMLPAHTQHRLPRGTPGLVIGSISIPASICGPFLRNLALKHYLQGILFSHRLLFQRTMGCTGQVIWSASSTPWWGLTRSNNLLLPFKSFFSPHKPFIIFQHSKKSNKQSKVQTHMLYSASSHFLS